MVKKLLERVRFEEPREQMVSLTPFSVDQTPLDLTVARNLSLTCDFDPPVAFARNQPLADQRRDH